LIGWILYIIITINDKFIDKYIYPKYNIMALPITPIQIALTFKDQRDNSITDLPNRPSFCDDEILGFQDPMRDLGYILQCDWIKTEDINEKDMSEPLPYFRAKTYSSTGGTIILMAISCKYDDLPDDGSFLVLITPEEFIIVAVVGAHPLVETSYMSYCNSDGSGPDLFDWKEDNPKILAQQLVTYYNAFISDEYH
jgi:hypothetical protein